MFKSSKIDILIGAVKRGDPPTTRTIDAMIDDVLAIAIHPVPVDTFMYRRCPGGYMYTSTLTNGSLPVYPMPADVETAIMFAKTLAYVVTGGLQNLSWDRRNELAQAWQRAGQGKWVDVLPEEAVI